GRLRLQFRTIPSSSWLQPELSYGEVTPCRQMSMAFRPYISRVGASKVFAQRTLTISLKNNFTSHFNAQKFSDLIPVHSGLVLTRAVTDYFFGHCFKRVRLIADVPGISRHVLKSNLEIHIGLIRYFWIGLEDLVLDDHPG